MLKNCEGERNNLWKALKPPAFCDYRFIPKVLFLQMYLTGQRISDAFSAPTKQSAMWVAQSLPFDCEMVQYRCNAKDFSTRNSFVSILEIEGTELSQAS